MNNKERLRLFKKTFQNIHFAKLTHDHEKLNKAIHLICGWTYALNASNGEASDYEVLKKQDEILRQLGDL